MCKEQEEIISKYEATKRRLELQKMITKYEEETIKWETEERLMLEYMTWKKLKSDCENEILSNGNRLTEITKKN